MAPSKFTKTVTQDILEMLDGPPSSKKLATVLRHLAKWRAVLIKNSLTGKEGKKVLSGPFKGMNYDIRTSEGSALARLLGCYEHSLAPIIEEIIDRGYSTIMDIGCAEGYYAVGLARRMPDTTIMAFDTNPKARKACTALAELNKVADRVQIGGTAGHSDFHICAKEKVLIVCDIEGAEDELLDPEKAPELKFADILVEVHDCYSEDLSTTLENRFKTSHKVTKIERMVDMSALPDWMEEHSDLDRLLALWEWRTGPTPWLWMQTYSQIR